MHFDSLICVDYSAAGKPALGKDSLWVAGRIQGKDFLENFPTRQTLHVWLDELLAHHRSTGHRLLAGFDFAFGYPRGFAEALGLKGVPWAASWALLHRLIEDAPKNANNRFQVGAELNRRLGKRAAFWGRPASLNLPDLPAKKLVTYGPELAEWRAFEIAGRKGSRIANMQPGWKLAYAGSVGSQSLMGIARLQEHKLDFGADLAIWPFESAEAPLVFAEIYPSMFKFGSMDHPVKDARQVMAVVDAMAQADLARWLDRRQFADDPAIEQEEGWLLSWPRGQGAHP